ncbi:hypothetical protein [Uliginosibacterium sediminicola]|uniref:Uncharacterized protein n=1 Tax=Uliginosibacterium sediminicola TaxID=2024550 RepID=A0ABU9Z186_9RHOO
MRHSWHATAHFLLRTLRLAGCALCLCMLAGTSAAQAPLRLQLAQHAELQREPASPDFLFPDEHEPSDFSLQLSRTLHLRPITEDESAFANSDAGKLFKLGFWFVLLFLAFQLLRDNLQSLARLLSGTPLAPSHLPFAPWPLLTVVFESLDAQRLASMLASLQKSDYPAERLRVLALCRTQDSATQSVLEAVAKDWAGRLLALPAGRSGDTSQRCFQAGLQHGAGEILLALHDRQSVAPHLIRACASRFFDPSLGALLDCLPDTESPHGDLAQRLTRLQRGNLAVEEIRNIPPGMALLGIRRSAASDHDIDVLSPTTLIELLAKLTQQAYRIALCHEYVAIGHSGSAWQQRGNWLALNARTPRDRYAEPGLRAPHPAQLGRLSDSLMRLLWLLLASASLTMFFLDQGLAAACGLALCALSAYGLNGRPQSLPASAVLTRTYCGRNTTPLMALSPIVFLFDLLASGRGTLCALLGIKPKAAMISSEHSQLSGVGT